MSCVPKINGVYWLCLALASLFGANAGDFLADGLGLGPLGGLAFLAAGLAGVFLAERLLKQTGALSFWAAIALIGAAAANVADAFHEAGVRFATSVPVACLLLAFMVIAWRTRAPSTQEQGFIPVTGYYWLTMLVAGVLGTVAGDAASYPLGFGNFGAMVAFAIPLTFLLAIGRHGLYTDLGFYWLAVVFIRAAGTAAGDLLTHGLHGIALSTALSGIAFAAFAVVAYELRKGNKRRQVRAVGEGMP
ncbi:hypothetical protein [Pleomorphomonas carboxyditropha]|uniref:Uncharacterized protein n=1 Tax=Pleomorphomonas carboxyditropha TaxID=2023338 RepID=A0A2G9WRV7_9HYPH|nr:hypothetical protein [Pleomorphomonas carboxyditropha]PIO97441.1 hypothetical protein CJ014_20665 [Pleomorphomonas carboxyditropha]